MKTRAAPDDAANAPKSLGKTMAAGKIPSDADNAPKALGMKTRAAGGASRPKFVSKLFLQTLQKYRSLQTRSTLAPKC